MPTMTVSAPRNLSDVRNGPQRAVAKESMMSEDRHVNDDARERN